MNADRIQALGEKIRSVLTDDLLKPEWRDMPGRRSNTAGHCYVATEAMYYALGGKKSGFIPQSGRCPGGVHWWLEDADGTVVDITWDQFTKKELQEIYASGRGRGFQGKPGVPSKRAQVVLERISGAKKNPVEPRTEETPLFRSVSPWEMAEILRTGMIEGRSGWFSGDPRREKFRVWFGEKLNDVPHNGEDWDRYIQSSDPFKTLSEQAWRLEEIARAAQRQRQKFEAYGPKAKLRDAAEDLAAKLREKLHDAIMKTSAALAKQRDAMRATSYVIEMDFLMPGGTRYTEKDSLSIGPEVGFADAVPYSDAASVYLIHSVAKSDVPPETREEAVDEIRRWKVVDNVNPRDVQVEVPKIPAKTIIAIDALVHKSEAKIKAIEEKAGELLGVSVETNPPTKCYACDAKASGSCYREDVDRREPACARHRDSDIPFDACMYCSGPRATLVIDRETGQYAHKKCHKEACE